ncbi:hypothetical protein Y1Q_0011241 [Alligator mississippiensis]|uniref:Uncharacterized protein n=1 Tax=Alligator mississippiensis TaxID=8496 RepID=A0A151N7V0_ALLMI|nr:hypothetical protein Y1Q_0011241 [Alligator mississippiensis]
MTQATFLDLLEQFYLHLEWQDTNMQEPLPVDTKLAITLLKLAMPASLHYIGHLFGMGKVTTGDRVLEVHDAL